MPENVENITPCYSVHLDVFEKNCRTVMDAFEEHWGNVAYGYSVKTNHDNTMMKYAHDKLGWMIEVVSKDEWDLSIDLGFKPNNIILNGPYKKDALKEALLSNAYVNLDNLDEVDFLCGLAQSKECMGKIDLSRVGLRVNVDLESMLPGQTTAGDEVSRFGLCVENGDLKSAIERLRKAGIEPAGLHMHTSTKSRSLEVFECLAKTVVAIVKENKLDLTYVDMGGGFFGGQLIPGKPTMQQYAKEITDILKTQLNPKVVKLIVEPGASVIATSVTYESKVVSVRDVRGVKVVTLDGSLLHVNPFMAKRNQPFKLKKIDENDGRAFVSVQVICGSTCMENDRFAKLIDEEEIREGDILSFEFAGAYTMAFNSHFILEPPVVKYLD